MLLVESVVCSLPSALWRLVVESVLCPLPSALCPLSCLQLEADNLNATVSTIKLNRSLLLALRYRPTCCLSILSSVLCLLRSALCHLYL